MKKLLLLLSLAFLMSGCSGVAVKQDYNASINFKAMKTYAWQEHVNKAQIGGSADNALVSERVVNSVDEELAKKGYKMAPLGQADFLVDYSYAVVKEIESDSGSGATVGFGSTFGGGVFGMFGLGLGHKARKAEIETLSIDISAPVTALLIWKGFIEQELIRRSDPAMTARDIRNSVGSILSKFPPKKK